jgi:hypothetical protein
MIDCDLDYLQIENVDNFDWDLFLERYYLKKFYLAEAFTYQGSTKIPNGSQFSYHIITAQNSIFNVFLNWIDASSRLMDETLNYMNSKLYQSDDVENFKTVYELTKNNPSKKQLFILFANQNNQTHITNQTKENESFTVFKSLEDSLRHFYTFSPEKLDDTLMVKFMISKAEPKRLKLYQKIWKKFQYLEMFQNILVDKFSNPTHYVVTLY